jgi:hypothetical protein
MEDDLKKNENGRQPQQNKTEEDLKKMKDNLKQIIENNLRFLFFLMEDLGANLSWGWLSSVRFLLFYCHNPTNNPKQLKTTFVGVVL